MGERSDSTGSLLELIDRTFHGGRSFPEAHPFHVRCPLAKSHPLDVRRSLPEAHPFHI